MSAAMSDGVVMKGDMVFNTIACWNTHLNGSVGVVNDELHFNGRRVGSFVDRYGPTAGASAHGNEQLVSTDGGNICGNKHHCAQTV